MRLDVTVEKLCGKCDGSGQMTKRGKSAACDWCRGTGYVVTVFGQEVIDMLVRQGYIKDALLKPEGADSI